MIGWAFRSDSQRVPYIQVKRAVCVMDTEPLLEAAVAQEVLVWTLLTMFALNLDGKHDKHH